MTTKKKSGAHLFIDTNVLLNFFAYSKDDLKQLDKLIKLVHAKTIKLYITQQVVDEFSGNRDAKLAESFTNFKFSSISGTPSFMLGLPEHVAYEKSLNVFEKSHSILTNAAKAAAKNRGLAADKTFSSLLEKAGVISVTDEHYAAANRRHRLGNPPGKNDSLGDQLNWEILLSSVPSGAPLHIVTRDGDYASKLNSLSPNTFLTDEWKKTHDAELLIYEQIGRFFQDNFPNEDFSLDIEKREAIDKLINSGAFTTTHSAIARLSPYLSFLTEEEAEEIVQGSISNSQISWIMGDTDIERFFKNILEEHGDNISPRLKERLEELLGVDDDDDDDDEEDDEPPF
jgi:hypothetical protein